MIIGDYSKINEILDEVVIPRMVKVRQIFPEEAIEDVAGTVREKLHQPEFIARIQPGMRVALTGSSRKIANMNVVLREVASFVRERGAEPYIIPAMGSHGGSTAQGQKEILTGYGITEEFCGCPIHSSMEVAYLGDTPEGLPVYIDKFAAESDAIILVGRIKGHTAFRGTYESGLAKMMTIGLGKQVGADSMHDAGFGELAKRIPIFAKVVLEHAPISFGVGVMENALDQTCRVEVLKGEEIMEKEPALLEYAKSRMPRLMLPETDVLIVREIGKNFSGSGMDPNVTGTWSTPYGGGGIRKQRTVVLDVADSSHGNFLGLGQADTTTFRVLKKMDLANTYPNALTSTVLLPVKMAMFMDSDKHAIQAAIKTLNGVDKNKVRIVYIKNTLYLKEIFVSEALLEEVKASNEMEILEEARAFQFDPEGNLVDFAEEL